MIYRRKIDAAREKTFDATMAGAVAGGGGGEEEEEVERRLVTGKKEKKRIGRGRSSFGAPQLRYVDVAEYSESGQVLETAVRLQGSARALKHRRHYLGTSYLPCIGWAGSTKLSSAAVLQSQVPMQDE